MDVAEAWNWAEASKPMVITLRPPVTISSVAFTYGSANATALDPLTEDFANCVLSIDGEDDMYYISANADPDGLYLSRPFTLPTDSYDVTIYRLEYDNSGKIIDADSSLPSTVLSFDAGKRYAYNLYENGVLLGGSSAFEGSYSPSALATQLTTLLNSIGTLSYTVDYSEVTGLFTIGTGLIGSYSIDLSSAASVNSPNSMGSILGLEPIVHTGSDTSTIVSSYRVNGVLRITRPMTHYRESSVYSGAAKDAGKIFMVDNNTFTREFPLSRLSAGVPTRFCITQAPDGYCKFKFNSFVDTLTPVEVNYIPVQQNLIDSTTDVPLVPTPYTKFLVYGAAYFLLLEKSDTKAQQYFSMAQMQLKAMVNDNRKGISLGGQNFGRLVPRAPNRNRYYSVR